MTLEMVIGAVGIVVAAITFIAGMLAFSALDKPSVERGPGQDSDRGRTSLGPPSLTGRKPMLRSGDVPAGLWLGTAVGALAVSVGLARNPTEEAVVAIVGLVVCALVFVSVVSRILSGRSRSPEVNGESVAALDGPGGTAPGRQEPWDPSDSGCPRSSRWRR